MTAKQETFASMMETVTYHYDLRAVFEDLLTMTLCALSQNPRTGKSHDEDLYLATIAKYSKSDFRFQFPKLFGQLVSEMEDRVTDSSGNDVLGEYYERQFCRKNSGQFFTPPHICDFMAYSIGGDKESNGESRRVLDPTCGSGRMLLSAGKAMGKHHELYGIDIDHTCVKMTAINLFLNGFFHAEVMWANALVPDDFHMSYRTSLLPFGVFRIQDKERSRLWHLYKNSFTRTKKESAGSGLILPSQDTDGHVPDAPSQLTLF